MADDSIPAPAIDAPEAYFNRELSWLGFARRVLALTGGDDVPLFERVNFAGIMGMLHDEFFMKRISGLKRQVQKGSRKRSLDGKTPSEELAACRKELREQSRLLCEVLNDEILPALAGIGQRIAEYDSLKPEQQASLRDYFRRSVQPILTPLAVDQEHPFPFISNLGLNLAVVLPDGGDGGTRFVRIKVPNNRPRWIALTQGGFAPLEQVIAANLDLMFPGTPPVGVYMFRVTRGASGTRGGRADLGLEEAQEPGSIVGQVSSELKARRFAGVVRVQVGAKMPKKLVKWLASQLDATKEDVYATDTFLGVSDLMELPVKGGSSLRFPPHEPATHPRLANLDPRDSGAIFSEIRRGDLLLHHPYHSFDTSVLRFLQSAAVDPKVLAIKLTIYRTSRDSPTVKALVEAARRGKQVAVLVEITARFDEAPNIAWGEYLENEGVHVSYGVERLKTHVKLALIIREEGDGIERYVHVGTGNYHEGTARIYEDLGLLTRDPDICEDVGTVFNSLTGATPPESYRKMIVAPRFMRQRFVELIRREARHAAAGRPCGIHAKMNQLQDPRIIRELYRASRAGVPIVMAVRGLCCLRPGVEGLSASIRVFSVVGRFLEHSRIYRFTNGGAAEHYLGSADWMKRNLDSRVETIVPVLDDGVQRQLDEILEIYESDSCFAWEGAPDGSYERRVPGEGEPRRSAQETFLAMVRTRRGDTTHIATRTTCRRGNRSRERRPASGRT